MPGYWERSEMSAPRSTVPASISRMVGNGLPSLMPEYCTATAMFAVVDM